MKRAVIHTNYNPFEMAGDFLEKKERASLDATSFLSEKSLMMGKKTLFPHYVIAFDCVHFSLRTCVNA